jgi:hypothetical protein
MLGWDQGSPLDIVDAEMANREIGLGLESSERGGLSNVNRFYELF